jgi:hypothetical protein
MKSVKAFLVIGFVLAEILTVTAAVAQEPGRSPPPPPKASPPEGVFIPGSSPGVSREGAVELAELIGYWLVRDWADREKPKAGKGVGGGGVDSHLTTFLRAAVAAKRIASAETRKTVLGSSLETEDQVCVLPLGRIEWEKPPTLTKSGKAERVPVLCVLVAAKEEGKAPWRTCMLKGEWRDASGKKVAQMTSKASNASPSNGVFIIVVPVPQAAKEIGTFAEFQFKLTGAKVLK